VFESAFAKNMVAFLELRDVAVGKNTLRHDKTALTSLDRYLTEHNYRANELTEEILNSWIQTLNGKSKTRKEKVSTVRKFVEYINEMGSRSFLPDIPKSKSDYIPYIYSDEEVQRLIHYADNLDLQASKSYSPHLQAKRPMILRVLYGCGTRLGETLALRRKDIDFKTRTILLRKTKFSNERRIPLHESLINILEKYCLTLGIMLSPDAYLFPGAKPNAAITSGHTRRWFTELLKRANIDQREKNPRERGASLHCFRHLFVLKSMRQLETAGHSVDVNDLLLPTYLGHASLLDTDKYMRFSGALIPESLEAFEAYTTGLIPKVEAPYEEE
jgi:integrase